LSLHSTNVIKAWHMEHIAIRIENWVPIC